MVSDFWPPLYATENLLLKGWSEVFYLSCVLCLHENWRYHMDNSVPVSSVSFRNRSEWIKHDDLTQQLDTDWIIQPLSPWQRWPLVFPLPWPCCPSNHWQGEDFISSDFPRVWLQSQGIFDITSLLLIRFLFILSLPVLSHHFSSTSKTPQGMCLSEHGGTSSRS